MDSVAMESLTETACNFVNTHTQVDLEVSPEDTCPICLEGFTSEQSLRIKGIKGCSHLIGFNCLKLMLRNDPHLEKKCPMCRAQWLTATARVSADIRQLFHEMEEGLGAQFNPFAPERESQSYRGLPVVAAPIYSSPTDAGPSTSAYHNQLNEYNDFRRDVQSIRDRARSTQSGTRSFRRRNTVAETNAASGQAGSESSSSGRPFWPLGRQRLERTRREAVSTTHGAADNNTAARRATAHLDEALNMNWEFPGPSAPRYAPRPMITPRAERINRVMNNTRRPSSHRQPYNSIRDAEYGVRDGTISTFPAEARSGSLGYHLSLSSDSSDDEPAIPPISPMNPRASSLRPLTPIPDEESTTPPTTPPHLRVRRTSGELLAEDRRLQALSASLSERDIAVRNVEFAILFREIDVTSREDSMVTRERDMSSQESRLAERENQILAREQALEERVRALEAREGRVDRITNMVVSQADELRALVSLQQQEITRTFGEGSSS